MQMEWKSDTFCCINILDFLAGVDEFFLQNSSLADKERYRVGSLIRKKEKQHYTIETLVERVFGNKFFMNLETFV